MALNRFQILSESELTQIHEASLHILEHCGVSILNPRLLDILRERGLAVDAERRIVRFTRACVEDAVAKIPSQIAVFDREGKPAFTLGDGIPRVAAGHNAVFWLDPDTGVTRPSRVADVERFAQLCEHLPQIDMIGVPVMPQDVADPGASLLYGVRAVIANSRKPIYFSTDRATVNRGCIDLLRAAFGGDLSRQPYGISQLSPTSPLFWEEAVLDAVMDTVALGVPLAVLPEPNAGVSAPYTLAGLLTVHNVECLSGMVMAQLLRPGAPVIYASSWTTTDMRDGAALVGSVETSLCRIAGAQLARLYQAPYHTTAPNSDNHAHDEQNAWEKMLGQFCSVGAGTDLIVNCGMFATGMTCSHEQLLMDAEMSALARRMAAGIAVNRETIARELIEAIGPRGETYLTTEHTLQWLHSDEYLNTSLSVRGSIAAWQARGAKDTAALARDQAQEIWKLPVNGVPAKVQADMEEIVRKFSAK